MRIVADSREQLGYAFTDERYAGTEVTVATLSTGDYSLRGLENVIACERKSLTDLIGCLGRDRDRFERELQRARALDAFVVIVEGSWADLVGGNFRSQLNPHSAAQSIASFTARLNIPFWFCGNRAAGEYCVYSFLHQWLKGAAGQYRAIIKASEDVHVARPVPAVLPRPATVQSEAEACADLERMGRQLDRKKQHSAANRRATA